MKSTLIRLDNGKPFVNSATLVYNSDGSVSFKLPSGSWAGQEPNIYGQRHPDQPGDQTPGVYQRATLNGNLVVFVTRPQDDPMAYMFAQGQNY